MEGGDDKLGKLLGADLKVDRVLERLDDVGTITAIIHEGRVRRARSSVIAQEIVEFLKGG